MYFSSDVIPEMVNKFNADIFLLFLLNLLLADGLKFPSRPCSLSDLVHPSCSPTEICSASLDKAGYCDCLPDHVRVNETYCITKRGKPQKPEPSKFVGTEEENGSTGHLVASIFVPILVLANVIWIVYFIRKYRLISYIRKKISQRNRNYDEVMIGRDLDDDDPPLS